MSVELYFGGAESPTWRRLLIRQGVKHMAVSYSHLRPRLPKAEWRLVDHFPDDVVIFLDSGAFGINKKRWTPAQQEGFLNGYLDFVQTNMDRLAYFTECDFLDMGVDWVLRQRSQVWETLAVPTRFVPVWHQEWPTSLLREMVEQYDNLGVPPLPDQHQNVLAGLVRRTGIRLHGLSFSHHSIPQSIYSTLVSSSWISPMRFGETHVWDHNRLRRYPADDKDKVRRRYRRLFAQAEFDGDKIADDDNDEVARYTVWAWRQLEASMTAPKRKHIIPRRPVAATEGNGHDPESSRSGDRTVEIEPAVSPPELHTNGSLVSTRTVPLPVFGFKPVTTQIPNPDGPGTVSVTSQVPVLSRTVLRQCDSCSLAAVCPEFTPGSPCRFDIPIEIRNRDQLVGILMSILEVQGQRVAFGRFSEELQGGYPDQNVSIEADRFVMMAAKIKEIMDNRDFLKVTVEGRGEAGVLRRLFGEARADALHQMDPNKTERAVRHVME